ncbi:MAG TPA: carboxypeptidase regulatory-like domain-containing protein, partial [Armatimonadetes bacterium]|nr:carboxypeptidase regulatory-like domain-containing protein [Armatimonadota bacterium]
MIPQCKRWQLSKTALLIGLILCQPLLSVANSGEISGQVFKPDGQTPAAGVTVWLSSPDERLRRQLELPRSTRTTKDGRYTFKELIAGEYAVRAVDDSGLVATQSTRLINDDARVGVWLTLRSMAREGNGAIWGYVRDANDNAVTNITVLLRPIGMMGEWQKKNTDEFGMVLWSDVPPGEYEITLVSPRYVGRFRRIPMPSIIPSQRITVQPNKAVKVEFPQITQTQNVVRKPKLIIRGQLVDDKGRPIANTRVYLLRLGMHTGGNMWMGRMQMMYNYRAQTKTDNEGRFTLPLVTIPPVIFVQTFTARWKDKQPRLHAILRAEGFAPITAEFNPPRREAQGGEAEHPLAMPLPLNQPIEINLNTLKLTVRSGDIQVRVVDAITEKPIPNAWVILLPRRTGEALRARQVMMARIPRSKTDDGGIAFLKDIIPGKYRL